MTLKFGANVLNRVAICHVLALQIDWGRVWVSMVAHHGDDPVFWQVSEKGRHGYKGGVDQDIGPSVQ